MYNQKEPEEIQKWKIEDVISSMIKKSNSTTKAVSKECNLFITIVKEYFKKHKFHPYKMISTNKLLLDYFDLGLLDFLWISYRKKNSYNRITPEISV